LRRIASYSQAIQTLARARPVIFLEGRREASAGEDTVVLVLKESEVVIPRGSMADVEAERKRLQKEIEQTQAAVARLEVRLKDKAFLTKAPAAVVDKERRKLTENKARLEKLRQESI
jgi:valyl-tRNA synthetase